MGREGLMACKFKERRTRGIFIYPIETTSGVHATRRVPSVPRETQENCLPYRCRRVPFSSHTQDQQQKLQSDTQWTARYCMNISCRSASTANKNPRARCDIHQPIHLWLGDPVAQMGAAEDGTKGGGGMLKWVGTRRTSVGGHGTWGRHRRDARGWLVAR